MQATVKVVSAADCGSRDAYAGQITSSMICAGIYPNGGIDTCQVGEEQVMIRAKLSL